MAAKEGLNLQCCFSLTYESDGQVSSNYKVYIKQLNQSWQGREYSTLILLIHYSQAAMSYCYLFIYLFILYPYSYSFRMHYLFNLNNVFVFTFTPRVYTGNEWWLYCTVLVYSQLKASIAPTISSFFLAFQHYSLRTPI